MVSYADVITTTFTYGKLNVVLVDHLNDQVVFAYVKANSTKETCAIAVTKGADIKPHIKEAKKLKCHTLFLARVRA